MTLQELKLLSKLNIVNKIGSASSYRFDEKLPYFYESYYGTFTEKSILRRNIITVMRNYIEMKKEIAKEDALATVRRILRIKEEY